MDIKSFSLKTSYYFKIDLNGKTFNVDAIITEDNRIYCTVEPDTYESIDDWPKDYEYLEIVKECTKIVNQLQPEDQTQFSLN